MSPLALTVLISIATPSAPRVTVAVLPLQPQLQARPEQAAFIEERLHRQLRRKGATIIVGPRVAKAMKAAGATDTASCDTTCLVGVGKALGADRVIAPALSRQVKEQSDGAVWIWTNRQAHVAKGTEWGFFGQSCMCADSRWEGIARDVVTRMLAYDPAAEATLPPGAPVARPTEGPRKEPGMVYVPAGPFIMGSLIGEGDERPVRVVTLDAFYIDKYEVTNGDYNRCVEARKCVRQRYWRTPTLNQPTHPVIGVGWDDGVAYCSWAGKRLPTEAEWEKAARGTDAREFPWGNDFDPGWLNQHNAKDGWPTTAPVGHFKKNVSPYGAYDMAGNAWEWTADYWNYLAYRYGETTNPTGAKRGKRRVMRGGSWMYDIPFFSTTHNRSPGRPWIRKRYVGFRCAKGSQPAR